MCGGGAGSANDSSNDDKEDSGNSLKETLANIFTPGDGMSYVDGRLTENNKNRDQKFYDYSPNNNNDDGPGYTTIDRDGEKTQIRRDVNDKYKQRYASALFGAATGGLPGLIGSIATNELTKGKTGAGIVGIGEAAGDALGGISQIFATPKFENQEEEEEYRAKQKMNMERHNAMMASMQGGNDGGNNSGGVSATAAPTVALPGANMPPSSDMSAVASQAFQPIPNPDYDPNDPMSQQYLSNPTYAQLLAYQQKQNSMGMGMAEGGEVGGNEKTAISDAISAVKGQMPEEQAAIALGVFLQNYGEEALKNLVERVQSGEFDDTVDRFANGEAGEVVGPGDGSGVDDKVPASLEGQQDVLLADGEFVLRKKTADALEKKYGGGFLDTINEAEDNAPRTMQEYMTRA
jgi:hypothetical protein